MEILEHNTFQQTKTNNSVALYGSSTFKMWDNAKNDLSINNLYSITNYVNIDL